MAHKIIAKLADDKNVFFMDLTSKMVGPDGITCYFEDGSFFFSMATHILRNVKR